MIDDEPQYCDVCCLRICAGRCGCGNWEHDALGVYQRTSGPPEVLMRMRPDKPTMPDVMLRRVVRKVSWYQRHLYPLFSAN